jgi:hypothetical protein
VLFRNCPAKPGNFAGVCGQDVENSGKMPQSMGKMPQTPATHSLNPAKVSKPPQVHSGGDNFVISDCTFVANSRSAGTPCFELIIFLTL